MGDDLAERIASLSDADAIAALAWLLDLEDVTAEDTERLKAAQNLLPEAFEQTPGIDEVASPDLDASPGDAARATLAYLAEQAPDGAVAQAIGNPRRPGQRDPLTLAVGGLILLALKSEVELKRSSTGKWTFRYHLKPTKDSALAGILAKLWGTFGGGGS